MGFEKAVFAGGCFWGVEHLFQQVPGVISATSGYAGGETKSPTYEEVSKGKTGHAEAVLVTFDSNRVSYDELLDIFWRVHNPTQLNRQGPDVGTQYRSAIFYLDDNQKKAAELSKAKFDKDNVFREPSVTEIVPLRKFHKAEDFHQNYVEKNPGYVCHTLRPK